MEGNDTKICSRCILDTAVPGIQFDEKGECEYCKLHDILEEKYPSDPAKRKNALDRMVAEIKERGKGRPYDCVIGVSGGCDSTYLVYWAKKAGLRPLAVHLDNGWNSPIAENNLKSMVARLDVKLETICVDQEEFFDLQKAFLKASVPDIEIPTDVGIYSTLYKVALEKGIPAVLNGHSFRTEGSVPGSWTYMDGKYLDNVFKKFGSKKKLENFNNLYMRDMFKYLFVKKIKEYRPLEYMDYDKKKTGAFLEKEIGWEDYGGHHYESIYTRFVASYILPEKFDIDKRKVTFSAMVRSGKLTRAEALSKIEEKPYPTEKIAEDRKAVLAKFNMTEEEFQKIMELPPHTFKEYPSYYKTLHRYRYFVKKACDMGLLPEIMYQKYAK